MEGKKKRRKNRKKNRKKKTREKDYIPLLSPPNPFFFTPSAIPFPKTTIYTILWLPTTTTTTTINEKASIPP